MAIKHVDINTDLDHILEIVDQDAAVVIDNVLAKEDLGRCGKRIRALF